MSIFGFGAGAGEAYTGFGGVGSAKVETGYGAGSVDAGAFVVRTGVGTTTGAGGAATVTSSLKFETGAGGAAVAKVAFVAFLDSARLEAFFSGY